MNKKNAKGSSRYVNLYRRGKGGGSVLHLSGEALLGGLPVDDVPDGLEVLGLAVLVLEAVQKVAVSIVPI